MKRNRVLAELDRQAQHEGETINIAACRLIVQHVRSDRDLQTLLLIQHHRYGKLSYEARRFYYLHDWVAPLVAELAPRLAGEQQTRD